MNENVVAQGCELWRRALDPTVEQPGKCNWQRNFGIGTGLSRFLPLNRISCSPQTSGVGQIELDLGCQE